MTRAFERFARLALLGLTLSGCSSALRRTTPAMQQERDWNTLLTQVDSVVGASRYDIADQLLSEYAARNPAGTHTADVWYWRALYKLDPANVMTSPHEAIALLDSYLASTVASGRRTDAAVLRHVAVVLEVRAAPPITAAPPSAPTPVQRDDRAKDEEIAKLRDELAKANAELERIKKRLAAPSP